MVPRMSLGLVPLGTNLRSAITPLHCSRLIMPSHRRFPLPWSVEERSACFVVNDSAGQKLCGEFAINSDASSAFSFEGPRVVSIIVLMAVNAVRFRCA